MRRRIIDAYGRFLARQHRWVLIACLGLAGVAVALLPRFEFRTARSALTTTDDPDIARFEDYLRELGPNAVPLLAEGGTEAQRREFMEALARELAFEKGRVDDVFYKLPVEFFRARIMGLRPADELRAMVVALEDEAGMLAAVGAARGLPDLLRMVKERIEKDFQGGRRPQAEDPAGLRIMRDFIAGLKRIIEKPAESARAIEKLDLFGVAALFAPEDTRLARLARGGYITSRDGSMYLALVRRRDPSDSPENLADFLAAIRRAGEKAREGRRDVTFGLTGNPVIIVEEHQTVGRDAVKCSIVAAVGICLLVALAFRRRLAVLLILISLGVGILWNCGLTWAIFGGLNLITSSVPVILLALGIDFGIHVVSAYERERGRGRSPREAIVQALARTGPGLITGAVTTALAFYAICFMEFQGFREFGVIAGNGVLVSLLAMVSVLPALLIVTDRRPDQIPAPAAAAAEEAEDAPYIAPVRLKGLWHRVCRSATAFPLLSTVAAAAVTVYCLILAQGIEFEYQVEDLLPRNAESVRVEEKLKTDPQLSPAFALAFFPDRAALEAADQRASRDPLIGQRESIINLLPEEATPARAEEMARMEKLLRPVKLDPDRLQTPDPRELHASIQALGAVFERALDMVTGLRDAREMRRNLDQIVSSLETAAEVTASPPPGWVEELSAAQRSIWSWAAARKAEMDRMLALGPVKESDLPIEVLDKLKGPRTGRYVLYMYPAERLEQREALKRFVDAARGVDRDATGYPIIFYASTSLIHRGFSTAVAAAAVVIFFTLFLDFRKLHLVLLATVPKVIAIVWMLGIMRLLGLNYNLANQIVIPLLIGVGLAYGIHIIHRFFMRGGGQRDITSVLEHTGGAIALSGLTTMIGFGSLGLATHRGLASMGTVLFFGVGAALVASTWVLANLLRLIYRPKR